LAGGVLHTEGEPEGGRIRREGKMNLSANEERLEAWLYLA